MRRGTLANARRPRFHLEGSTIAKLTGKNLYAAFAGTALNAKQRSFEVMEKQETVDSTAGADDYRNTINTVKTIGAKMELIMETHATGGSAILAALTLGAEGTLIWGAEGSGSGLPKDGFYARLIDNSKKLKFDDLYLLNLEWENAGTARSFNGITDKFP